MSQRGFTIGEMVAVLAALASLALTFFICYVVVHFIVKFW